MAVLVNLALCIILGILQVSSKEYKYIQTENTVYETKCSENINAFREDYEKCMKILRQDSLTRMKTVEMCEELVEAVNKCCGKESEEMKCIEESVLPPVQKLIGMINEIQMVLRGEASGTFANISYDATNLQNKLACCYKVNSCVQKIQYPTATFKENIKECKCENCKGPLKKVALQIPPVVVKLVSTSLLEAELIKALPKFKENYLKDGKCKEDKGLDDMSKDLNTLNLKLQCLLKDDSILSELIKNLLTKLVALAIQILECSSKKECRQLF